jgi:hypothetical protein
VEKEPLGLWFLRVFSRAFLTVLIPLYGGYVGAPIVTLLAYIFAIGAVSLYFFGTPPGDRDNSWAQRGGFGRLVIGWLLMSLVVAIGAVPAFAIGYLFR